MKQFEEAEIVEYMAKEMRDTFVPPGRKDVVMEQVCAKVRARQARSISALGTKMERPK